MTCSICISTAPNTRRTQTNIRLCGRKGLKSPATACMKRSQSSSMRSTTSLPASAFRSKQTRSTRRNIWKRLPSDICNWSASIRAALSMERADTRRRSSGIVNGCAIIPRSCGNMLKKSIPVGRIGTAIQRQIRMPLSCG